MDTFKEICDKLVAHADVIDLLELLNITASDIVARFEEEIELNIDDVEEFLDDSIR